MVFHTLRVVTLTLWRPLLSYGYNCKASCARPGWAVSCNFWHQGTLTLRACPDVKNYKWRLNPVWRRMHHSCTHNMTTGNVKGLTVNDAGNLTLASFVLFVRLFVCLRLCLTAVDSLWLREIMVQYYVGYVTHGRTAYNCLAYCSHILINEWI